MEILVSAMKSDINLVKDMNIQTDVVIVNQCEKSSIKSYIEKGRNILWIDSVDRGLSRSRNKALKMATQEICIFADDDLVYVDDVETILETSFRNNPEIDIITFQVEGINKKFKKYSNKEKKLGYIGTMKVASVEIAFRRSSLEKNKIEFNEKFGSGSEHSMGEENIFLYQCLKKKLKIKYIPIKIADLYIGESTWFKGYNEKYFHDLGAVYEEMTPMFSMLLIFQFALRKKKLYQNECSTKEAITYMIAGRKMHKNSA